MVKIVLEFYDFIIQKYAQILCVAFSCWVILNRKRKHQGIRLFVVLRHEGKNCTAIIMYILYN